MKYFNDYKDDTPIIIKPGTVNVAYKFQHPAETGAGEGDGALPYGLTVSSRVVTAFKKTNSGYITDTELVSSSSLSGNDVICLLSYPSTNGVGKYKITFTLTMSDGRVDEWDFPLVMVRND